MILWNAENPALDSLRVEHRWWWWWWMKQLWASTEARSGDIGMITALPWYCNFVCLLPPSSLSLIHSDLHPSFHRISQTASSPAHTPTQAGQRPAGNNIIQTQPGPAGGGATTTTRTTYDWLIAHWLDWDSRSDTEMIGARILIKTWHRVRIGSVFANLGLL